MLNYQGFKPFCKTESLLLKIYSLKSLLKRFICDFYKFRLVTNNLMLLVKLFHVHLYDICIYVIMWLKHYNLSLTKAIWLFPPRQSNGTRTHLGGGGGLSHWKVEWGRTALKTPPHPFSGQI